MKHTIRLLILLALAAAMTGAAVAQGTVADYRRAAGLREKYQSVHPPVEINGAEPKKSPDGKLEALVRNYNVAIRKTGAPDVTFLSTDGSEGCYYDPVMAANTACTSSMTSSSGTCFR